jgi:hypothetical protein
MPPHEPTARPRARAASSNGLVALALALAAACSGTDVGYPRYIVIERGAGGSDAAGAEPDPNPLGGGGSSDGNGGSGAFPSTGGDAPANGGTTTTGGTSGGSEMAGGKSGAAGSAMAGASARGGAGGSGTGGSGGTGDAGSATTGGTGTGGSAGSGGSGAGGTSTAAFAWPDAYDPTAAPAPADGHHNAGATCLLSSCHGTKVPFLFGGTVYRADGTTAAAGVEVGLTDGSVTLTAYSAANGNIWLLASAGAIDWTRAIIALRNANGEVAKPADAPRDASCNASGCHASTNRMLEP